MNAKIYGDEASIKQARASKSGSKDTYINFDAIEDLPEEYEAVITTVEYDPKRIDTSFTNVGSKNSPSWYPKTELMYKIAEACGISGEQDSDVGPMIEEVDINPLLMRPLTDPPTMRKMVVGRLVSKRSSRLMEDGTKILSSNCTAEHNVWERCLELWSKEEQYTDGYAKAGKYDNKYDNQYKRKAHFDSEMKFAHAKAETKAYVKTIRELAGMPTGFLDQDLTSGKMFFARIRRSKTVLKMETAARLSAISQGMDGRSAQKALFGPEQKEIEEPTTIPHEQDIPQVPYPEIARVLNSYLDSISDDATMESVKNVIAWVESDPEHYMENAKYYEKALAILKGVEASVPEQFRIPHDLY